MIKSLFVCFAALFCVSGHAQIFRPATVKGAVIGGVAGAVIGNNSGNRHNNGVRGAVIGAATGAVIGTIASDHRRSYDRRSHVPYRERSRSHSHSSISVGIGYGPGYWNTPYRNHHRSRYGYSGHYYSHRPRYAYNYGYYAPVYSSYPYEYNYGRPSRAASGALLGGIAGAIIGNNSGGGSGLQGAAIGAGAGLLLGSLADSSDRDREYEAAPIYREQASAAQTPASTPAPQNVTIINNYYGSSPTPMATANGLFGR